MPEWPEVPIEVWAELARERRSDPINRMYELVKHGKISPRQSEAWARDRGFPTFEHRPAAAENNPMKEIDWTLALATAWLIWRTPEAVREQMAKHVEACTYWVPHDHRMPSYRGRAAFRRVKGFELRTGETPSPAKVLLGARTSEKTGAVGIYGKPVLDLDHVEHELRAALRDEKLIAFYGNNADPIAPRAWSKISPFTKTQRSGPHDAVFDDQGDARYLGVRVERDAVIKVWPKLKLTPSDRRRGPKPIERSLITNRMLADLRSGKLTGAATKSKLHHTYGAKRTTCEAAFRAALLEFETSANSGNN